MTTLLKFPVTFLSAGNFYIFICTLLEIFSSDTVVTNHEKVASIKLAIQVDGV